MAGEDRRAAREALGMPEERQMPFNLDCEQAVLGSILLHNESYQKVADILTKDSFFEPLHQKIYEVAAELIPAGKTANTLTLQTYLGNPDLGGTTLSQYLARLRTEAAMPIQVREYAGILNDLAIRRQTISIAMDAMDLAYNAPVQMTAKDLVDGMVDKLSGLKTDPGESSDFEDFDGASYRAILAAQDIYQKGGQTLGLSTGLPKLDEALGGLNKTNLIILAGRPAMGKSSLATNIALSVAKALKARRDAGERTGVVAFNSLEMSTDEIIQRIVAEESGVPMWKIKRGFASAEEMERFVVARQELGRLPLSIDKTGELTIGQLQMRARALKKRRGLELLVVDYLQLLKGSARRGDHNRVQEVTEITTGLKALAKELNVPILALSQLSRRVEERDDKRPMLSDLRESGSIEQDADVVMFVYRDEYYLKKQKPPNEGTEARLNHDMALARAKGVAEVIIGKNRHGPEATVELGFDSNLTKFTDEPPERDLLPDPEAMKAAKKEKGPTLPNDSFILLSELRALMLKAEEPSADLRREDARLRKNGKVIPVDEARARFAVSALGDETDENKIKTKFSAAMKPLIKAGEAYWTGSESLGFYVWIPSMVGS